MNYQEIILNELLDKYEKSKSYTHEVNRKISVTVSQMKQYHTENYEEKMYFHEAVKTLQKKNLIDYNWIKHEKENLLDKIWLVKENVSKAYQEINRVNPKEKYTSVFQQLSIIRFHIEWMENFRMDMMQEMNDKQRECTLLPVDHAKDIILALQKIDNIAMNTNTVSVLKRTFSVQCYKNSKHFEREVEKYLLKILKKYYLNKELENTELRDDELLAEVGITKYPEIVEFCGDMECYLNGEKICFSSKTMGSYINSYAIMQMSEIKLYGVKTIIFIENKANYMDYMLNKKPDEFVIYHGGVYSPIKGEFFKKIVAAIREDNISCYHWSDIDIGGFTIFVRLRDSILKELIPYKMNKQTLIYNEQAWQHFDEKYGERLLHLRGDERFRCFWDVIDFMLEHHVRLEQESLIA